MNHWKITLNSDAADKINMTAFYPVEGWFIYELLQMSSRLSNGDKMSDDLRRDMGQRIRAVIEGRI